jgi:hypothetical protein
VTSISTSVRAQWFDAAFPIMDRLVILVPDWQLEMNSELRRPGK